MSLSFPLESLIGAVLAGDCCPSTSAKDEKIFTKIFNLKGCGSSLKACLKVFTDFIEQGLFSPDEASKGFRAFLQDPRAGTQIPPNLLSTVLDPLNEMQNIDRLVDEGNYRTAATRLVLLNRLRNSRLDLLPSEARGLKYLTMDQKKNIHYVCSAVPEEAKPYFIYFEWISRENCSYPGHLPKEYLPVFLDLLLTDETEREHPLHRYVINYLDVESSNLAPFSERVRQLCHIAHHECLLYYLGYRLSYQDLFQCHKLYLLCREYQDVGITLKKFFPGYDDALDRAFVAEGQAFSEAFRFSIEFGEVLVKRLIEKAKEGLPTRMKDPAVKESICRECVKWKSGVVIDASTSLETLQSIYNIATFGLDHGAFPGSTVDALFPKFTYFLWRNLLEGPIATTFTTKNQDFINTLSKDEDHCSRTMLSEMEFCVALTDLEAEVTPESIVRLEQLAIKPHMIWLVERLFEFAKNANNDFLLSYANGLAKKFSS